jgi:hypothetical protein
MTEKERISELIKICGKDPRPKEETEEQKLKHRLDWALQHKAIDRIMEAFKLFENEFPGFSFSIATSGYKIYPQTRYKDIEISVYFQDFTDENRDSAVRILLEDERFKFFIQRSK